MKPNKQASRFALVILLLATISAVVWIANRPSSDPPIGASAVEPADNVLPGTDSDIGDPGAEPLTTGQSAKTEDGEGPGADSPEELAELIRQFAATGASTSELYRKLTALGLKDRPWWRSANDVSALLDLASDLNIPEQYRIMAMGIYLAAAPQAQLSENSAAIQKLALASSDSMASVVLQGMADRSESPSSLTRETLTSGTRGTGAKCYAWYAARLTQKNDPGLAAIALATQETRMTEATKVGYDYLASGSFQDQFAADPRLLQGVEDSVLRVKSLQPDAEIMDLANGDAFIRAVPSILPTDAAVNSLFSILRETPNPEMRLSVIEQLVSVHISGAQDLSQELHDVRNDIATLFSDPVKQTRAKKRLNRAAIAQGD